MYMSAGPYGLAGALWIGIGLHPAMTALQICSGSFHKSHFARKALF